MNVLGVTVEPPVRSVDFLYILVVLVLQVEQYCAATG